MTVRTPVKPIKPVGPKRTKSKMGCRTCRIRRVKCDERKPTCERCISTGRVCDGYGIWGGGGNAYGSNDRLINELVRKAPFAISSSAKGLKTRAPAVIPGLSSEEYAAFDFFRRKTSRKLPGVFDSDFWDFLVLQLSIREPAVLHSAIALAATHRHAIALGNGRRPSLAATSAAMDFNEILALQQFNKAVGHLQRSEMKDSLRTMLVCCIIFISIELLKGEIKSSQAHFQSGLKLLREMSPERSDAALMVRSQPNSIDEQLAEAFTRLNIRSSILGDGLYQAYAAKPGSHCGPELQIPLIFDSLNAARRHLDRLSQEIDRLSAKGKQLTLDSDAIPADLVIQQQRLQRSMESWRRTLLSSLPRIQASQPEGSNQITLGAPLLNLYYNMVSILCQTCLRNGDECAFDLHTMSFATILEDAVDLWSKVARFLPSQPSSGGQSDHLSFTVDMGFIPPLYYTALKCRVPKFRRLAIGLLVSAPHREGVWDGAMAAAVVGAVMEMEEGTFYTDAGIKLPQSTPLSSTGIMPSVPENDVPLVPRAQRVNYANVTLPECGAGAGGKVSLECRRYNCGGGAEKGEWTSTNVELDPTLFNFEHGTQDLGNCAW